jgi:hypothetical protein
MSISPTALALVETHTWPNQDASFPGYNQLHRSDLNKEISYGTLCLSRKVDGRFVDTCTRTEAGCHVEITALEIQGIHVIFGYKSPKASLKMLTSCFNQLMGTLTWEATSTIVTGDFNLDLNTDAGKGLLEFMLSKSNF